MTDKNTALLKKDMAYLKDAIDEIRDELKCQKREYVSKIEFTLVKEDQNQKIGRLEKLVYGAVSLGIVTLGKAVLDLVVISKAAQ